MEFTAVDAGIAVIILVSAVLAYSRGFTRELFALAGWVIAFIVAYYAAPMLDPLLREVPVVGPVLAQSCIISMIASFTVIVAAMLLILSVFTPLVAGAVLDSFLGPLDRMLGFLFGVVRGVLLVAVAYLIYANFAGAGTWPMLERAASRQLLEESARLITENLPERVPSWFGERVDALMVNCEKRPTAPSLPRGATPPAAPAAPSPAPAPGNATGGTKSGTGAD